MLGFSTSVKQNKQAHTAYTKSTCVQMAKPKLNVRLLFYFIADIKTLFALINSNHIPFLDDKLSYSYAVSLLRCEVKGIDGPIMLTVSLFELSPAISCKANSAGSLV